MGVLLLRLAGPLQSWGSDSRFTERKTQHEPTKSGVVGLLSAALGRSREESVDDLAALPLAMRVDQPGHYERDFQTAHTKKFDKATQRWEPNNSLPLSNRYYLSDAVFVVGVEVGDELLDTFAQAILSPAYPLFLGRRSCSPSGKILLDACPNTSLEETMRTHPWEATNRRMRNRHREDRTVACELLRDRRDGDSTELPQSLVRDYPVSFSQQHRSYEWRTVVHEIVQVPNPHFVGFAEEPHDPLSLVEEKV